MNVAEAIQAQARLYDELYRVGYHQNIKFHHAAQLLKALERFDRQQYAARQTRVSTVLDVGCSHGAAVGELWKSGYRANGVDVSSEAIYMARAARTQSPRCSYTPCFRTASATALPYHNMSFDALLSSDVLEHVPEAEAPRAVAEMARVARVVILVKISNRVESGVAELNALRNRTLPSSSSSTPPLRLPNNLHLSVHGPDYWLALFELHGWYLHHSLQAKPHDAHYTIDAGMSIPWQCCSYVLQPASAPLARETAVAELKSMQSQIWYSRATQCLHWGRRQCVAQERAPYNNG